MCPNDSSDKLGLNYCTKIVLFCQNRVNKMKNELLFIIKSWIAFAAPSTISACFYLIDIGGGGFVVTRN